MSGFPIASLKADGPEITHFDDRPGRSNQAAPGPKADSDPELPGGPVRASWRKSRRTETGQLNARQISADLKRLSDRISALQPGFGLPVGCLCFPQEGPAFWVAQAGLGRERAQVACLAAPSSRAFYAAELLKFRDAHGGTPRTGHAKSVERQVRNTRVSRWLHGQTEIVVEFEEANRDRALAAVAQ